MANLIEFIVDKAFQGRRAGPIVRTYKQKVDYLRKSVKAFKKGLPWFFGFNVIILVIIPLFILGSLFLTFTQIEYINKTYIGIDIIIEILLIAFLVIYIVASASFQKFKKLIKFFREKNDFNIDESEAKFAIKILEKSPIKVEEVLADPTLTLGKTKKLISLMIFCDFIKIKNNEIYQSGLHLID